MRLSATPSWVANCNLKLWAGLGAVANLTGAIRLRAPRGRRMYIFVTHLFSSCPVGPTYIRIEEKCAYVETQTSLDVNENKMS